jgi:hypothetical protein
MFRFARMRTLGATVAVAALAAAGVTAVAAAPPASAIENGTSVSTAPPWAAYITTVQKLFFIEASATRCTGTVIANDWVLTAAHCVMQDDQNGNPTDTLLPKSIFEVVLGRSDLQYHWEGGQFTVDKIVVDPDWNPSKLTGDVALLHLKGSLPSAALPLPLAPSGYSLKDGQSVTSYGYGATSETYIPGAIKQHRWNDYTPHFPHTLQETQPGSYTVQMSCTTAANWCMRDNGPSEILNGDSGGPWMPDAANPFLVGVSSQNYGPKVTSPTTVQWQYHLPTRLTTPSTYNFITSTAGIPVPTADTIYRDPASGASWLAESDGFLHPIATGATYQCLTGKGDPVENHTAFYLDEIPRSTAQATCSSVGPKNSILLYGDNDPTDNDPSGMSNLASVLTAAGYKVTSMPGVTSLPTDISGYGQIWHYGIEDSPSTADQQTLESFVKAGGSVFLTGEWGNTSNWDNQADEDIINALVPTGPVSMPGDIDPGLDLAVNSTVIDNAAHTPNTLTTFTGSAVGGMTGVPAANIFVYDTDGDAAAALWDNLGSGHGRLAIVMDINWAQTTYENATTMPQITQNLAYFLSQN